MTDDFRVSFSALTLGTLYESVLAFSGFDNPDLFWPAVCRNARWIIPSRRMCVVLCREDETFEVVGTFEKGKFLKPDGWQFQKTQDRFWKSCTRKNPEWIASPAEAGYADDVLTQWLFHDRPETLFVLPLNSKQESLGACFFAMSSVEDKDRPMISSLGTVYALHAGMTYTLIRLNQDRLEKERELRKTENKYSVLFQNSNDGIFLVDLNGLIMDLNQKALEMFGYERDDLVSREVFDLHPAHEFRKVQFALEELITQEKVRFSVDCRRKDGSIFPSEISASLFQVEGKTIAHGLVRDMTDLRRSMSLERKRAHDLDEKNRELQQAMRELKAMQQHLIMQEKMASLGNLVAGVAHEVNNPIGAVNSSADALDRCIQIVLETVQSSGTLEDIRRSRKFQKALELLSENSKIIGSAGERISKIVRSLKNFARLDEAEYKEADIHEGLESTLTLLNHELRNTKVLKEYSDLPRIVCYPNQLNQVFMNLLLNASQAVGEEGQITILTMMEGGSIYVQIVDNGRGIPKEHLSRIFDPGFTTRGVGVGAGLGLSLCYSIVQKHRGSIHVVSEPGKGTTFTVRLPVRPVASPEESGGTDDRYRDK